MVAVRGWGRKEWGIVIEWAQQFCKRERGYEGEVMDGGDSITT